VKEMKIEGEEEEGGGEGVEGEREGEVSFPFE
jgi:hypothetical protein